MARRKQAGPPKQAGPGESQVDAVILTVLQEEYAAVCAQLSTPHRWPGASDFPNLYAWQIGTVPCPAQGGPYTVAVGMTGRPGTNESTAATLDAITQWQPRYVLFVGIAGGLAKTTKGDVVIADVIHGYEYGKIEDKEFKPRSTWTYSTDGALLTGSSAYAGQAAWRQRVGKRPPTRCKPKILTGEIASGDKVVDDPSYEFFQQVLATYPKAQAVEMEGAGVGCAIQQAHARGRAVGFLMIRGISDVPRPRSGEAQEQGKGTEERDAWKAYAAEVAAAFTVGYIADGLPVPPQQPHEETSAPEGVPASGTASTQTDYKRKPTKLYVIIVVLFLTSAVIAYYYYYSHTFLVTNPLDGDNITQYQIPLKGRGLPSDKDVRLAIHVYRLQPGVEREEIKQKEGNLKRGKIGQWQYNWIIFSIIGGQHEVHVELLNNEQQVDYIQLQVQVIISIPGLGAFI